MTRTRTLYNTKINSRASSLYVDKQQCSQCSVILYELITTETAFIWVYTNWSVFVRIFAQFWWGNFLWLNTSYAVCSGTATTCPTPVQVVTRTPTVTQSFSARRSPRMSVMWVIVLHPFTKFEVMADFQSVLALTSDLLTSKWSHGSPVSWTSFLSIFSLLCYSILDFGSGTGQTYRQTDNGHQCIIPHPRAGDKNATCYFCSKLL